MEHAASLAKYSFIAKRNSSISPIGWRRVFALISAVTLGIAAGFAAVGAWLVLPFAGIELALLLWAFRYLESHSGDYERVAIEGDRVLVEVVERNQEQRYEFNRCWVQVVLQPDRGGGCRLTLRSRGIDVEVGRHLSSEDRRLAARRLKRQIQSDPPRTIPIQGSHHDS
ncbi:MAG: DUF2244 domain-containing protein [Burkholderiales bacterium]